MNREEELLKEIKESIEAFFNAGFVWYSDVEDWLKWLGKDIFPLTTPFDRRNEPILKKEQEEEVSDDFIIALDNLLKRKFKSEDLEVITPMQKWVEDFLNELDGTKGEKRQKLYVVDTGDFYIEGDYYDYYYDKEDFLYSYVYTVMDRYADPISFIEKYKDRLKPGDYEKIMSIEDTEGKLYKFFETIVYY